MVQLAVCSGGALGLLLWRVLSQQPASKSQQNGMQSQTDRLAGHRESYERAARWEKGKSSQTGKGNKNRVGFIDAQV